MENGCGMGVRMSVVIPVFNKQESLAACLESLAAQTASKDSFEAIFIDDGSTDASLTILQAAQSFYPFVKVVTQENQGVSKARNAGIRRAEGDYIMFLDADDLITPDTIQALIVAFDKCGNRTDVFAYRMLYRYTDSGREHYHGRERWLWRDGVYQLEDGPFMAQTTINVCVRNRREDNILFNEEMKMGEDQLYVTQNLERKATCGYTYKAEYIYIRDKGSASSRMNNPIYAYEDMIHLFNELAMIGKRNVLMRRYVHCLILYNVDWRLRSDMLFPKHLAGEERATAEQRLAEILSQIPHATYEENPYLTHFHKAYLLKRYVHAEQRVQVVHTNDSSLALFEDESVWHALRPVITIDRAQCRDLKLNLLGHIACSTFLYENQPTLDVVISGKSRNLSLTPSSFSLAEAKFPITKAWSFSLQVDLSEEQGRVKIRFVLSIDGEPIPKADLELKPLVHNARITDEGVYCYPNLTLEVEKKRLVAGIRKSVYPKKRYLMRDAKNHQEPKLRHQVSKLLKGLGNTRYWMYVDSPRSGTEGSALVQLLSDLHYEDGVERCYISNYASELQAKYPELEGRVFADASDMHKALSLKSEIVVCSYLERFTFEPFGPEQYNIIGDLASKQARVYVQHGILHSHMPWYFSYDRVLIDKEVISTELERDLLRRTYGFPEDAVIGSGAPRLDRLDYRRNSKGARILYAPSWRTYLVSGTAAEKQGVDDVLIASEFYKKVVEFIRLLTTENVLEKSGATLEIKLHPNFKCYEHLFEFQSESISLAMDTVDESNYSIVITDYSSYVYDFLYVGARVLYFFPDRKEFDAGLNAYSKLDVDLRDGLGPYTETPQDAVNELVDMLNDCDKEDDSFAERRKGFFLHTDGKNCERLYQQLRRIANQL